MYQVRGTCVSGSRLIYWRAKEIILLYIAACCVSAFCCKRDVDGVQHTDRRPLLLWDRAVPFVTVVLLPSLPKSGDAVSTVVQAQNLIFIVRNTTVLPGTVNGKNGSTSFALHDLSWYFSPPQS